MTKLLRTGLSLLLASTYGFAHSADSAPQPGLLGHYYKGTGFNQPLTTRIDSSINFNWGSSSPMIGMPQDNFSVRWTGLFTAPHFSGTRPYRFTTSGDDGMRLFFKDRFVIDQWQYKANKSFKSFKSYSHTVSLKPGERVPVLVEFIERSGNAFATFTVTDVPTGRTIPISKIFITPDSDLPTADKSQPAIAIDSVDLSWTAPLTRTNGSSIALSEIQRYEILYGSSAQDLSTILKVDSDVTTFHFKSLTEGPWYFAVVVVDDNGLRSSPSKVVSKVLN